MRTHLIKMIKRSLLSAIIFAVIVAVFQLQADFQGIRPQSLAVQLTQKQVVQNAVVAVESIGMTVSDMDREIEFYSSVLSFQKVSDVEVLGTEYEQLQGLFGVRLRVVRMQLGEESIELTEYLTPKGRPIPIDSRSHDRWFQHIAIVVNDMDRAYQRLHRFKVQHTSTAPQRIPDSNQAAAGIRAFYFKDPDGHNLELVYFPLSKGNPKWQKPVARLFLGIDHTVIAVSDTKASLKFYRDLLGLKLAGESMNFGTEQEHLGNVQGARVQISSLRLAQSATSREPPTGAGIEFLDYLQPRDGRSLPADARPNDLLHWQTTLVVKDTAAIAQRLRLNQSAFVSSNIVTLPKQTFGFRKGFLVRDPDGHVMRLVEK